MLTELMARDGNNNNSNNNNKSKGIRGAKIFNRRMKDEQRSNGLLLQPMLSGQQRLLGSSEGDINRNLNLSSTSSPSLLLDSNNNNNNSTDDLDVDQGQRVNLPIDRRQSSAEPLQSTCSENGIGAEEDFEDIDGSEKEEEEGNSSTAVQKSGFPENKVLNHHHMPPSTSPVSSLCSSNC